MSKTLYKVFKTFFFYSSKQIQKSAREEKDKTTINLQLQYTFECNYLVINYIYTFIFLKIPNIHIKIEFLNKTTTLLKQNFDFYYTKTQNIWITGFFLNFGLNMYTCVNYFINNTFYLYIRIFLHIHRSNRYYFKHIFYMYKISNVICLLIQILTM